MSKFLEKVKKYKKDIGLTALAVTLGISAVLGQHFTDVAKTPFWWTFWDVVTGVGIAGFVGGFIYLVARNKSKG